MARKGWIKVWHKLADDPMWLQERFTRGQAWLDLLLMASTQDMERPGQVCCSIRWLANRWKWSSDKVSLFLSKLEQDGMIVRTLNRTDIRTQKQALSRTLLTIVKYRRYQIDRTLNRTDEQTQEPAQNRTIEEDKEKSARRPDGGGAVRGRFPDKLRDMGFSSWEEYDEWRQNS